MEEEHTKEPSHNNPEEAAQYVKDVNTLLQTFVSDIHGFNRYARLTAYTNFLHALSRLLSKLDSTYFTTMDTELYLTQYQIRNVPPFLNVLKKQQIKYSNVFPVTAYQQALKLHPKCAYKKTSHHLIRKDKKSSLNYLATFKTHTTTWHK